MAVVLFTLPSLTLRPPAPANPPRALDVVSELVRRAGGTVQANSPVVEAVKADLLQTLAEYGVPARGVPPAVLEKVESLCTQLEACNPTPRAATSNVEALDGDWCVRFSDAPPPSNGMLGPFAGDARQIVNAAAKTYENRLDLGPLTISLLASFNARDADSLRVRFDTITPSLFGVGPAPIRFPEGTERTWLLTYTDADLRIVRAGVDGGRSTARELGLVDKDEGQAADAYVFVLTKGDAPRAPAPAPVAALAARRDRAARKAALLEVCEGLERGARGDAEAKARVAAAMEELAELNPTPDPASSPLLQGTWDVVWTTEAELLLLTDKGFFGLPCLGTSQTIGPADTATGLSLTNSIDFDGGFLRVGSSCAPEPTGGRVNFAFENCAARWRSLEVPLPPVGSGWFEVLYLDADLRLCRDLRGDLQVCRRRK